ncbi:MAG: META domain-containing protein [Nonlabens sp.]
MKTKLFIIAFGFMLFTSCRNNTPADEQITLLEKTTETLTTPDLSGIFKLETFNNDAINASKIYTTGAPQPYLTFDTTTGIISGHTGCNTFTMKFTIEGDIIQLAKKISKTDKNCNLGAGWENSLLEILSDGKAQIHSKNKLIIQNVAHRIIFIRA